MSMPCVAGHDVYLAASFKILVPELLLTRQSILMHSMFSILGYDLDILLYCGQVQHDHIAI